jgi:hypothetical protein
VNRPTGLSDPSPSPTAVTGPAISEGPTARPWYWEGNVQSAIVKHLISDGWSIISNANTATREAGKDIVATKENEELWISVKGWPDKSINTQARHWFAGAIFDLILYRDLDPDVTLGIGIPAGYSTYANLIPRVQWLRRNLPFSVFSVSEAGHVDVLRP